MAFRVIEVEQQRPHVRAVVESAAAPAGCRVCGVIAFSHGRSDVVLIDVALHRDDPVSATPKDRNLA